uniref:AKINbetagamma n=1 Tax=Solanum tuberosum TaxID=4113 RepID=M1APZ7_SOLTU
MRTKGFGKEVPKEVKIVNNGLTFLIPIWSELRTMVVARAEEVPQDKDRWAKKPYTLKDNRFCFDTKRNMDSFEQIPISNIQITQLARAQRHVGQRRVSAPNCNQERQEGIPMAPLWDFSRAQFVGVLSALDFILIMRELGNHGSNLTEEELETHTISAWKEAKSYLSRQANELGKSAPRQLVWSGPDNSLKDVALEILQNGVATVPIIHSPALDGSYPQLLYLASLSEILKHICRYFKHSPESLPILQLPIGAIPLGTWVPKIGEPNRQPLAMLRPTASLNAALNLLVQAQVSAIPIVDDNDSLLDIYSRSDITALAKDKIYTHINLEEMSIHQALQLAEEPYATYGLSSQKCHMCLRSDSLHEVMERLSRPGVRRVVVVEAGSKRVEGIISVGDIFKFLLG